jgi:hypothetical protein
MTLVYGLVVSTVTENINSTVTENITILFESEEVRSSYLGRLLAKGNVAYKLIEGAVFNQEDVDSATVHTNSLDQQEA